MGCAQFFEEYKGNREICKELQARPLDELISWERESASEHSPGIVSDQEMLCRQVLSPLHYDAVLKKLKPSAFDDASNKGLSVNRLAHTSMVELAKAAKERVAASHKRSAEAGVIGKMPNNLWGFASFKCSDAKLIVSDDGDDRGKIRGFAVYDTANKDDKSHADVCQISGGKLYGRSVRSKLADLANQRLNAF